MERYPWIYDANDALSINLEALGRAKAAGIDTLIDLTPMDLGRQPALFQSVAEADTGVNIICATGVYRWVPMFLGFRDPDEIAEHFLHELRDGIDSSGIRPGIIKLAWDIEYRNEVARQGLERAARGAARAAKAAGVPISCHTLATDALGTPLLDLFQEEGLDLRAVTIGHSNDTSDLDYLKGLCARGATVGLDRYFARSPAEEKERRNGLALALARAGYAGQVCLGHDASPYYRFGNFPGNPGCWLAVPQTELPWLRAQGLGQDQVDAMMRRSVPATFESAARMAATP